MGTESFNGLMDLLMMDSSKTTIFMELESMCGLTAGDMKENGSIIRCMEGVYSHGLTAEDMKEIIMTIRNKVEASLSGLMAGNMMENGTMENNTEKVFTTHQKVRSKEENGKKEKELDGLPMNDFDIILY
jgi:hypothetical protein